VFEAKIFLLEMSALAEPGFKVAGGFDDVHAGNNSGGVRKKSKGDLRICDWIDGSSEHQIPRSARNDTGGWTVKDPAQGAGLVSLRLAPVMVRPEVAQA
jgi:hypothetical protein